MFGKLCKTLIVASYWAMQLSFRDISSSFIFTGYSCARRCDEIDHLPLLILALYYLMLSNKDGPFLTDKN